MLNSVRTLGELRAIAKQERKRRKLTQAETAAMLGYTQKWLSDFETGRTDPPTSMVLNLMVGLGQPLVFGSEIRGPVSDPSEREVDMEEI